jgi:SAM-dependent methyltransferase
MSTSAVNPVWERELYGKGHHLNRYPFDAVVSFVYRNCPREKPRHETRILEVGCGAGNNLWFAAREGFQVTGIDGSPTAIEYAQRRFAEEGLKGEFQTGDFTSLPWGDDTFDLAVDRGAIVCCPSTAARRAVREVRRVLREGGRFFFNPYSARHSSFTLSEPGPDGLRVNIRGGSLTGVGPLCFYDKDDVLSTVGSGWKVHALEHLESISHSAGEDLIHAEWRVIAEKTPVSREHRLLRFAEGRDADSIFAWRNDPWIVSLSLSGRAVTPAEHRAWFPSALDRTAHLLFVVQSDDGAEVGTARLDRADREASVTIYLVRPHTGRGLGPRAIDAACRQAFAHWPGVTVIRASIRHGNLASVKAFRRAGFVMDEARHHADHLEMIRVRE